MIKQTLHREIESTNYTEYYSGNGTPILQLLQYPIISVTRVNEDQGSFFGQGSDANPVALDLVQGVDYSIMAGAKGIGSSGWLRRINRTWYRRPAYSPGKVALQPGMPSGNILVVYTAGISPVPPAIQMAVNSAVMRAVTAANLGGAAQTMSYEDASVSFFAPDDMVKVFGSIENSLSHYRQPVI